jgi:hypothetical protein
LDPSHPKQALLPLFSAVASISCLLAGITVVARIPRLTRAWMWRLIGGLVFLFFIAGSQAFFCLRVGWDQFASCVMTPQVLGGTDINLVWIAVALVLLVSVVGRLRPTWGMGTLLVPGALAVAYVVLRYANQEGSDTTGRLWPVFLAGAMFLYIWWLVALLFDLTFVWHRYIRMSVPIFQAQAAKASQPVAPAPLSGRRGALGAP